MSHGNHSWGSDTMWKESCPSVDRPVTFTSGREAMTVMRIHKSHELWKTYSSVRTTNNVKLMWPYLHSHIHSIHWTHESNDADSWSVGAALQNDIESSMIMDKARDINWTMTKARDQREDPGLGLGVAAHIQRQKRPGPPPGWGNHPIPLKYYYWSRLL